MDKEQRKRRLYELLSKHKQKEAEEEKKSNYYDNELNEQLKNLEITGYKVISDPNTHFEIINNNFPFDGARINFANLKKVRYVESSQDGIATDITDFLNALIQDNICDKDERIIYLGDGLTDFGYELTIRDLLKILPFLVNEIPQHHYFHFYDNKKIIYVSFENDIFFGKL